MFNHVINVPKYDMPILLLIKSNAYNMTAVYFNLVPVSPIRDLLGGADCGQKLHVIKFAGLILEVCYITIYEVMDDK